MKNFIDIFAFTGPALALGGAVIDFLLFLSMAVVQDSPKMDPAFESMLKGLGSGASTAFWLGIAALLLLIITHWLVKKPAAVYISHTISAGMGLIGIVVVLIPLIPVVALFVKG